MADPVTDETSDEGAPSDGWLKFLIKLAILAWVIRSLIVAPFSIPSGSMLPTMWVGDYLFVSKWPYGFSRYSFPRELPSFSGRLFERLPERGDIVIFRKPGDTDQAWVKRVIGLPGDTVAVEDGRIILNGREIPRVSEGEALVPVSANSPCRVAPGATPMPQAMPGGGTACRFPIFREQLPNGRTIEVLDQVDQPYADHFGPVTVPTGHLFLMGDNRDDSMDSRFPVEGGGIGFVPMENLVGRAAMTFWSTDGSTDGARPWTLFDALRSDRLGKIYR